MKLMRAARAGVGLAKVPIPECGPTEVLVRVKCFGVNRPDVLQNQGLYPARPGQTDILGLELSGDVMDKNWDGPSEVCALVGGGAYAEFCPVERGLILPIPFKGKDRLEKAACLPETVFTVWKNLFWQGPDTLKGKHVFIHGGASGIGSTGIAMAKEFGASQVTTTVGNEEKAKFVTQIGADAVFRHDKEEWWKTAKQADVILDFIGGDYLSKNIGLLRNQGRLVLLGFLQNPVSQKVNMARVLLKSLTITGSVLRSSPIESKIQLCDEIREHVWPRIESGDLDLPFISHRFSGIEAFEEAHETMTSSAHIGKIVVDIPRHV